MRFLDIFFPSNCKCIICQAEVGGMAICNSCLKKLPFLKDNTCQKCGGVIIGEGEVCVECKSHNHDFERVFCCLSYEDNVKRKIIAFKQTGKKYLGKPFAELLLEKFNETQIPFDIIIPVPINEKRLKERGFNQSDILTEKIAKTYGRVDTQILIRCKNTPHQTGLGREHRETNLENAFKVLDKKKIKGKTILLIDDIYTTGSTLDECARTLKKAGASKVYGLCLARTPFRKDRFLD